MKGPFFTDLDTGLLLSHLLSLAPFHNKATRRLMLIASLVTLCWLAPWRYGLLIALSTTFSSAMRMVDRVHHRTSNCWPYAKPTCAARFADSLVHVLVVANLADCRHAFLKYHALLA